MNVSFGSHFQLKSPAKYHEVVLQFNPQVGQIKNNKASPYWIPVDSFKRGVHEIVSFLDGNNDLPVTKYLNEKGIDFTATPSRKYFTDLNATRGYHDPERRADVFINLWKKKQEKQNAQPAIKQAPKEEQ
jgi:hypothetical protein